MFVFILVSPPGATKGAHEGVKGVYASIAKKKPVLRNISLVGLREIFKEQTFTFSENQLSSEVVKRLS